jgi:hypothetical protein
MSPAVREYSWWSGVNGFRLDHGFVSPAGVEILAASYVREVGGHILAAPVRRPDRPAISDHAALVLEGCPRVSVRGPAHLRIGLGIQ